MEEGERQIKNILIHHSKYSGFYFHKVSILSDEYINGLSGSYEKQFLKALFSLLQRQNVLHKTVF